MVFCGAIICIKRQTPAISAIASAVPTSWKWISLDSLTVDVGLCLGDQVVNRNNILFDLIRQI